MFLGMRFAITDKRIKHGFSQRFEVYPGMVRQSGGLCLRWQQRRELFNILYDIFTLRDKFGKPPCRVPRKKRFWQKMLGWLRGIKILRSRATDQFRRLSMPRLAGSLAIRSKPKAKFACTPPQSEVRP